MSSVTHTKPVAIHGSSYMHVSTLFVSCVECYIIYNARTGVFDTPSYRLTRSMPIVASDPGLMCLSLRKMERPEYHNMKLVTHIID